jgi:hypothetical protein
VNREGARVVATWVDWLVQVRRFWDGYQERLDLCAIDGQVRLLTHLVSWGSVVGRCMGDCGVRQLWDR